MDDRSFHINGAKLLPHYHSSISFRHKMESVFFFADPVVTEFRRLLNGRQFEKFWIKFIEMSTTATTSSKPVEHFALESISQVLKSNVNVVDMSYNDVLLLTKMCGQILQAGDRKTISFQFLIPSLEKIVMSWVPEKMDDACSFIRDLVADDSLSGLGTRLTLNTLKVN